MITMYRPVPAAAAGALAVALASGCAAVSDSGDVLPQEDVTNAEAGVQSAPPGVRVERLGDGPIITPDLHASIGENIQGPSLIRAPEWLEDPLGAYYLYFADHKGRYIRLAYADDLLGPWTIHPPGSLQIADSHFLTEPPEVAPEEAERLRALPGRRGMSHDGLFEATTPHIASPDVHVDDANRPHRHVLSRPRRCPHPGLAGGDLRRRHPLRGSAGAARPDVHAHLPA